MADDQEKTENALHLNENRASSFFYACRYGTKVKSIIDFVCFLKET